MLHNHVASMVVIREIYITLSYHNVFHILSDILPLLSQSYDII